MASDNDKFHPAQFLENKTIVIAGAGLAGSAFVVGLQKLWNPKLDQPNIIIYERDAQDVATRRETYNLSLTAYDKNGGLVVLRDLGLLDEALGQAASGVDGVGAFKIWDSQWREHVAFRRKPVLGIPSSSIRIAREDVRQVLHNSFHLGDHCVVHWESQCVSATELPDGRLRVRVVSGDGAVSEQDCDILIAADGASSKIRQSLRPDDPLCYNGAVLRGGVARFEEALPPQLSEDWGFVVSRTGVSAFVSPIDKHRILWTVGQNEDQVPGLDRGSLDQAQAVIDKSLELASHIAEPFPSIIKRTDPQTVLLLNSRDKMPFHHSDITRIPAIFLGDSNHALSPFAGIGANLALADGWELAYQMCKHRSLEEAVKAYDSVSVPRAAQSLKRSRGLIKSAHSTGWRYYLFWCVLLVGKFVRWMSSKMAGS
ncbi:FAD/NAD(P)-binding domain-containing protein [Trichoderma citrinoviride]|uniref:FAD/NAD(P)-binding domain-containing protein n=1 Tax=Trichoderma citrinoviride TaxID=58853 RepID=A0A2T4B967_9HYPO|nr:FAD/NAD(P)-binding domain-containing protein [Trichoderma citrinoviride]PTB65838.1 FAD/NAD(P)-binding domain-containing protein [Trichoderma citrinoviride]